MTETLDSALSAAIDAYVAANPRSRARAERAGEVMPGGNTRSVLFHPPFPLAFASGAGAHLTSLDGDEYVDLLGEFTAGLFGHSEQRILDAVRGALEGGISFGGHNALEARFAELLVARFPALESVRFTNSGTEANLMALALATAATGRSRVLVFRGAYHGGVLSFGGGAPSAVTVPHEWLLGDYNDLAGTRALIREQGDALAAVVVEPLLGSGGAIPGDPEFLRMLRDETARSGALLVADEVMTSRLAPGGLLAELGITPDLLALGKYLGGGMSFGAFGGRAELMALFDPRRPDALAHAGTFNNNVLTMSAGIAALERVLDDADLAALNARGDRLRERLESLFAQEGVALSASGRGSLLNLHATAGPVRSPADLAEQDPRVKQLLFLDLLAEGYWTAARGLMALSLPLTETDLDGVVAAMERIVARRRGVLPPR